jgi:glycosyltransferase involved in cell wall biosynthesis
VADLLAVCGEPLWPSVHGGRIRTARVVQALAAELDVVVAAPLDEGHSLPDGIGFEPLPNAPPLSGVRAACSTRPAVGRVLLGSARREALARAIARHRPRAVLFATSPLAGAASVASVAGIPTIVDFQDVEVRRRRSFATRGTARSRAAAVVEAVKAQRWERAVARRAAVVAATNPADVGLLSSWGARAVLVPHGADRRPYVASPADGPATFVGSLGYLPNGDAARLLLQEVWPRVREREPRIRLRIVGREAARALASSGRPDGGVEVISDPDETGGYYGDASVVVVPVRTGGGAQVKMAEALARGRVVVATAFSARSAPYRADGAVVVADDPATMSAWIADLWRDVERRWARERALHARSPVPTWDEAAAPLVEQAVRLVRR